MISVNGIMNNNNSFPFLINSMDDVDRMTTGEHIWEVAVLPHLQKITNTDMGISVGLPESFWDGSYDKEGNRKMIHLKHVLNEGPWKKNLLRPQPHNLPPGFTIIHMSLMTVATSFTRFFMLYYSKRYKALPYESKYILYNGTRVYSLFKGYAEKARLQEQGMRGFACPWAYEQYIKGYKLREDYRRGIPKINWAIKRYGYGKEVREARQAAHYETYNAHMMELAAMQPLSLPSLPVGIPEFKLLEEPPIEIYTAGA